MKYVLEISFKGCVRYILLVCFVCLKESTCGTRKNVFYFNSKALFVLEIIKFQRHQMPKHETRTHLTE